MRLFSLVNCYALIVGSLAYYRSSQEHFSTPLTLPPDLRTLSLDIELSREARNSAAIQQYAATIRQAPAALRKIVLRIVLVHFTSMTEVVADLDDALASRPGTTMSTLWKVYLPKQVWVAGISEFEDSETAFWGLFPRSQERFFSGKGPDGSRSGTVEIMER